MNKSNLVAVRVWGLILTLGYVALVESVRGQGTIVYVTPQPTPYYSLGYPGTLNFNLDINGDGTTDFILRSNDPYSGVNNAVLIPQGTNRVVSMNSYVANMASGDVVGSSLNPVYQWSNSKTPITTLAQILGPTIIESGNFVGVPSGYMGFYFVDSGNDYYGWLSVTNPVSNDAGLYALVTHWAYESLANSPIAVGAVPEPSTVGLIVLGGAVMWFRCNRERTRPTKARP